MEEWVEACMYFPKEMVLFRNERSEVRDCNWKTSSRDEDKVVGGVLGIWRAKQRRNAGINELEGL
jgi:hypothetical protein